MTIQCPICNADITEHVNKATATRAGNALKAKRGPDYFKELLANARAKRWPKKSEEPAGDIQHLSEQ